MKTAEKLYNDFMSMPYFRNYQAVSGSVHNVAKHEDAVKQVLLNNKLEEQSFEKLTKSLGFGSRRELRDFLEAGHFHEKLPNNSFYSQPTGNNDSPDFIFKVDNKVILLECKSGKDNKPMFNSGLPKKGYVYLLCSKKSNQSTMFLGGDIVSDPQREIIEEFHKETQKLVEELNKNLRENDTNDRGLSHHARAMWQQSGGKKLVDYFSHKNRDVSEQNVKKLFLK